MTYNLFDVFFAWQTLVIVSTEVFDLLTAVSGGEEYSYATMVSGAQ